MNVLSGVPINGDYIHSLHFDTRLEQTAYFLSKRKHDVSGMYRINRDQDFNVKVNVPEHQLYDCNYVMFQNTNYSNKWFYAFIDRLEYVNNETTALYLTVDPVQTWFFEMELGGTFIEREHLPTDRPGRSRMPEDLEIGNYKLVEETSKLDAFRNEMAVVVLASFNQNFEPSAGQSMSDTPQFGYGMYSELSAIVMTELGARGEQYSVLDPKIIPFFEKVSSDGKWEDGIVAVYMMPRFFAQPTNYDTISRRGGIMYENEFQAPTSLDGYTPRNNKLFSPPFMKFVVTDGMGSSVEYDYADFKDGKPAFKLVGLASGKPEWSCIPVNHKGLEINHNESFTIDSMPMVAYTTDAYRAWIAQNKVSTAVNMGTSMAGAGVGAAAAVATGLATGGAGLAFAGIGLASSVGGVLSEMYRAKIQPDRVGGGMSSGSTLVYTGDFGFRFYTAHIRAEFAHVVDSYFDMFGYKTARVGIPPTNARPFYTYVKTKGAHVRGSMPNEDAEFINEVLDRGITFWNIVAVEAQGRNVGDYAQLDNRPSTRTGWVN